MFFRPVTEHQLIVSPKPNLSVTPASICHQAHDNDAGKVPIKDIGHVVAAASTDDIKKLGLSTFDAVSAVGQPVKVSEEQVRGQWETTGQG